MSLALSGKNMDESEARLLRRMFKRRLMIFCTLHQILLGDSNQGD
jgi:hypothetical protein